MRTNVSAGFQQVRIIEVPDKRGPDNRGCTVLYTSQAFGFCSLGHIKRLLFSRPHLSFHNHITLLVKVQALLS